MKLPVAMILSALVPQIAMAQGVEDPLSYQVLLRMSGGLLLVVAMVFAGAWAIRRFGRLPSTGNSTLQLLGGIAVGQRERVVLIRVGSERLLLGVAPGRVQMLHTLRDDVQEAPEFAQIDAHAATPAESTIVAESFQHKLRGLLKRSGMR